MSEIKSSVLVIDDEPDMRDMLEFSLSQEGFEVTTAESGMAAVEAAKRQKFDLAVTDLKMPGMSGVETVAALKDIDPDIEIVVATGYGTLENAVACMKNGAFDFIKKPYDIAELRILLERARERSRLQGAVALYESSRAILSTLQHRDLIELVMDLARRAMRADAAGLALVEKPDAPPVLHTGGDAPGLSGDTLLPLATRAIAARVPLRCRAGESGAWEPCADRDPPAAVLAYPLAVRDRVLGALLIVRRRDVPGFRASELQRGVVFATQIALGLENARLYGELSTKVEELVRTQDDLVHAEKLELAGRLSGWVAHEINNPLSYVLSNLSALSDYSTQVGSLWLAAKETAEYLRASAGSETATTLARRLETASGDGESERLVSDIAEVVDDTLEGVRRIADLVRGFGELAAPAQDASLEVVDLGDAARAAASAFERPAEAPVQEIVCGGEAGVHARADRRELRTALANILAFLCDRAAGSETRQQPAPAITMCTSVDRDRPTLFIAAPGVSLGPEERARLFEPRVCLDRRARRTMRLDMGLAVAYQTLRRTGAEITVEDGGAGSTLFRLRLPAADDLPVRVP